MSSSKVDYGEVYAERLARLRKLRDNPSIIPALKAHYKTNPWDFIADWGVTYDPRNIELGLPAVVPFVPFPRQYELLRWAYEMWQTSEAGIVPKSRDTGASWCCCALAATLCLHYDNMSIGFGSRKEEYVDRLGDPKSLFFKIRMFLAYLPVELRGGWDERKHGAHMRITFPNTGSVIAGEAGDNIGRGDRKAIYFVDESAHLERPGLAEASLVATTNCRIDVSSVNGPNTPFSLKRRTWAPHKVFTFHWRDDPRKSEEWYAKLVAEAVDPVVIAQEYDLDETASVRGVVIPSAWVQSAIDAHIKLGIEPSGKRVAGLDVADEGPDLNAFSGRYGILLDHCESWSGAGSDIYGTTERALTLCKEGGYLELFYDADGLGAGVRGDAKRIDPDYPVHKFQGSAGVEHPERPVDEDGDRKGRLNKDYFANLKAQSWWALRMRFLRTHRAVTQGGPVSDGMISISSKLPCLAQLTLELSQPTYEETGAGKIMINKAPGTAKSPNLADSVMICFAPLDTTRRGFFA